MCVYTKYALFEIQYSHTNLICRSWQVMHVMNFNQNHKAERIILAASWEEVPWYMTGGCSLHRLLSGISIFKPMIPKFSATYLSQCFIFFHPNFEHCILFVPSIYKYFADFFFLVHYYTKLILHIFSKWKSSSLITLLAALTCMGQNMQF